MKKLKLARKFIESQGGFVTTKTPAELGYAYCPPCGTHQNARFSHCLSCGGEMVMPPNTACTRTAGTVPSNQDAQPDVDPVSVVGSPSRR
jgi:hypothetical protein